MRGHLNTDVQAGLELGTFCSRERCLNRSATAPHFGIDRTITKFNSMFFWPNSHSDVNNWIRSCEKCNEFNSPAGGYIKAPLTPIVTTNQFELVCYDLAGPFLPATIKSDRYALIMVDHFSHWPESRCPTLRHPPLPVLSLISGVVGMVCGTIP